MKLNLDCTIKLENILTANISTTQKYWILIGLNMRTTHDSAEESLLSALIDNLEYAVDSEKHNNK
jgi:hypothetical protein